MTQLMAPKNRIAVFCLIAIFYFLFTATAFGSEPAKEEKQAAYQLNFSFEDNLKLFTGEYVRITLSSGQHMAGFVKDVGNGLLHLEKLSDRDFFDALILIKDISAMDAKFRGPKR